MPPKITAPNIDILLSKISSNYSFFPKRSWLTSALASSASLTSTTTSENSLLASLRFRIIASDFKDSLHAHQNTCFPIEDAVDGISRLHNITLNGPIAVQIIDIEDLGTSKYEQLERIEMAEAGEIRKGREVIRVVRESDEDDDIGRGQQQVQRKPSVGPHKLLLEDAAGNKAYGFEVEPINGITTTMGIGSKLILRNIPIARGLLLLSPTNTNVLGGKVDPWNQQYLAMRKDKLRSAIQTE